jgi:hypothetical protein
MLLLLRLLQLRLDLYRQRLRLLPSALLLRFLAALLLLLLLG